MNTEIKYPATITMHWPTGPVDCCEDHAAKLVGLGAFLGSRIAQTKAEDDAQCSNCMCEAEKQS